MHKFISLDKQPSGFCEADGLNRRLTNGHQLSIISASTSPLIRAWHPRRSSGQEIPIFSSHSFISLKFSVPFFILHLQVVQNPFPPHAASIGAEHLIAASRIVEPSGTSDSDFLPEWMKMTFGKKEVESGKWKVENRRMFQSILHI